MRVRTKIYDKVTGAGRKRRLRNLVIGLLLLSIILSISVWMIIEVMNQADVLQGSPWQEIRVGEIPHLLVLFLISFSFSALYIVYYKHIREIPDNTPRYLLAIAALVVLARLLFRF